MIDLLGAIKQIRNVPHTELNLSVRRVVVILTSPRSGSSVVKETLAAHPDFASLDGEIEPFLCLTKNGFGYASGSDAIHKISHQAELVDNIIDDLTLPSEQLPSMDYIKTRWIKRLLLQYSALFSQEPAFAKLNRSLDAVLADKSFLRVRDERVLRTAILSRVFVDEPWRISYFDGHLNANANHCFNEPMKIEEPPFVTPRIYRRPFSREDARNKILLFKTPPDAYRIGMYEHLFPNADVKYIHLTRGYAQTVNGLMDGWLSPTGFFSHDLRELGIPLRIKGYSDSVPFGSRWWKFDMPPNWREYTKASLEEVCLNQWTSSHEAVLASRLPVLRVSFEAFIDNPSAVTEKITRHFDLPPLKLGSTLPVTMATAAPEAKRWKKREDQLLAIGKRKKVREMMESLEYEMNPEKWT